ncbi:prophage CP4-57 integrase [Yersinia mollaretii]|uniref:integrase domain-containing protein n=1 Tax=Yersinia mollaretii TaxID=33060 RepID=UPI0005E7FF05|nr:integrase domain-containing protein [Yersinia mollaretii]CQQ81378.1 prophage CP4-57 integrase [Yersinia mollaretii]
MARTTRPLTHTEVQKAKAIDKDLTLHDGDGLFLLVKTTGKKIWRFRYQLPHSSKRTMISLGAYPALSLADAREIRAEKLAMLVRGTDPQARAGEEAEKLQIAEESIFVNVARKWFELKRSHVSADHAKDIWRSLEKDILPSIENITVQELKARTLIQVLEPIKARGALETVRRLVQRINEIMIYAVNIGLIEANPASGIGNAFERPKKMHMPTIRPQELCLLLRSLQMSNLSVPTRCLLEWQLLTLARPTEASATQWCEIDLQRQIWCIPAKRMKAKREHLVPLSLQSIEILKVMQGVSSHRQYVFPSRNDPAKPMNSQTANAALKRIGYGGKLVAHGFRSIASTAMNENGFNPDVIEAALAHSERNEVRRAYNRTTYLEQRVKLMSWWGEYIDEQKKK